MGIKVTWRSFCEAGHWKSRGYLRLRSGLQGRVYWKSVKNWTLMH